MIELSASLKALELSASETKEELERKLRGLGKADCAQTATRACALLEAAGAHLMFAPIVARFFLEDGPAGAQKMLADFVACGMFSDVLPPELANLIGARLLAAAAYALDPAGGTRLLEVDGQTILVAVRGDGTPVETGNADFTDVDSIFEAVTSGPPNPPADLARLGAALEGIIGPG